MPSNRTPTRFYGPATLPSTPTTLYTVAGSKLAVIRAITIVTGTADSVTIGINGIDPEDLILNEVVAGGASEDRWKYVAVAAGETINGLSDDDFVTVTIDGDLYDA